MAKTLHAKIRDWFIGYTTFKRASAALVLVLLIGDYAVCLSTQETAHTRAITCGLPTISRLRYLSERQCAKWAPMVYIRMDPSAVLRQTDYWLMTTQVSDRQSGTVSGGFFHSPWHGDQDPGISLTG